MCYCLLIVLPLLTDQREHLAVGEKRRGESSNASLLLCCSPTDSLFHCHLAPPVLGKEDKVDSVCICRPSIEFTLSEKVRDLKHPAVL